MITNNLWRGNRYAVLGLARSGRATVDALLASGAQVIAWDENAEAREATVASSPLPPAGGAGGGGRHSPDQSTPAGQTHPNPFRNQEGLTLADPLTIALTGFTAVIVSPGVPLNRHPIAAHAAAHDVPVIGDIELFAQARAGLPPHKVVGITGTNARVCDPPARPGPRTRARTRCGSLRGRRPRRSPA